MLVLVVTPPPATGHPAAEAAQAHAMRLWARSSHTGHTTAQKTFMTVTVTEFRLTFSAISICVLLHIDLSFGSQVAIVFIQKKYLIFQLLPLILYIYFVPVCPSF